LANDEFLSKLESNLSRSLRGRPRAGTKTLHESAGKVGKSQMPVLGYYVNVLCAMILVCGCASIEMNRSPEYKAIEQAFFKCSRCKSLEGGIYGKGPFKTFRSAKADACVHCWERVTMVEFKQLASEWFGASWDDEILYWSSMRDLYN
jgi:hypothetical protein